MRKRRWLEVINYYQCEIKYLGNANLVAAALSRKSQVEGANGLLDMDTLPIEMRRLLVEICNKMKSSPQCRS